MQIRFVCQTFVLNNYDLTFIWYKFWKPRIVSSRYMGYFLRTHLYIFYHFSLISNVSINILEYAN